MHQLNSEYFAENVYITMINRFNTFWYIQKSYSRQQLLHKKVILNKFCVFSRRIRKSLIVFHKIGKLETKLEIINYQTKLAILVKKKRLRPNL